MSPTPRLDEITSGGPVPFPCRRSRRTPERMTFSWSTSSRTKASRRDPKTWIRVGHVEEDGPEATEVRPRREAARRDENEISVGAQQCGAHRHEEGVDVGLTVNHRGSGDGARIRLADLEIRRIGDDDIEVFRPRPEGEHLSAKRSGMRQYEVGRFDADGERDAASAAPVAEAVEHGPQGPQRRASSISWATQALRLRVAGNQRLHGRATENADPGRPVEDTKFPAARLDPPCHEVGDGNRREEETMLLAVPIGLAGGVPLADAVGMDRGPFAFARCRHGEGSESSRRRGRLFLQHPDPPFSPTCPARVRGSSGRPSRSRTQRACTRESDASLFGAITSNATQSSASSRLAVSLLYQTYY